MVLCSAATGIPKEILMQLRQLNATGFKKDGRINFSELKPWMDRNPDSLEIMEKDSSELLKWKTILMKSNARIAEKQLEKIQGRYIDRDEFKKTVKSIAKSQREILRELLVRDLPPRLNGKTVPEIVIEMEKIFIQVCDRMKTLRVS
jgi:glutamyl/glutaminyl-tRNA synthetase